MFDLSPDEIQETVVETLHGFAEAEIRPAAREAEAAKEVPERVSKQVAEMGFGASVPEEFGGSGVFDAVTTVLIAEELAWGDPGIAASILWAGQPALLISLAGTDDQRSANLEPFTTGAKGSVLMYERDGEPFAPRTTARKFGNDWKIDGEKVCVPSPSGADTRILIAGIEGSDEIGAFIVPKSASTKVKRDDNDAGKIGLRAAHTGIVEFDGVIVPGDSILGGDARNPRTLQRAISICRLQTGSIALGLARAAAEYAAEYASDRIAFGKPIGAFQGVAFMVTDMAMDVDATRLLIWDAASRLDAGDSAERAVELANSKATKTAMRCGTDSVQVLGGHGYIVDHPVEKWYRDAGVLSSVEGTLSADPYLAAAYAG